MAIYHHTSIGITSFEQAVKFYTETLSELSSTIKPVIKQFPSYKVRFCNFIDTVDGSAFCINDTQYMRDSDAPKLGSPEAHHICFYAPSKEAVDRWYAKALELGATSNTNPPYDGTPGVRPHYGNYYGAFVIDRDGYRLEACVKNYVQDQKLL